MRALRYFLLVTDVCALPKVGYRRKAHTHTHMHKKKAKGNEKKKKKGGEEREGGRETIHHNVTYSARECTCDGVLREAPRSLSSRASARRRGPALFPQRHTSICARGYF